MKRRMLWRLIALDADLFKSLSSSALEDKGVEVPHCPPALPVPLTTHSIIIRAILFKLPPFTYHHGNTGSCLTQLVNCLLWHL